uniref:Uncharacterized protein n=1 Tax=Physcomitrium patens TaxID=3218 RepID=A0A2K1J0I6_PHYPA|nr:hypothetical protein PHYPA_022940 [Physcomitrium patens]
MKALASASVLLRRLRVFGCLFTCLNGLSIIRLGPSLRFLVELLYDWDTVLSHHQRSNFHYNYIAFRLD